MGFTEQQLAEALQNTNNNYEAALAYLLGDRDAARTTEVPLIRALANSPLIQRGVRHARFLDGMSFYVEGTL
jgi:hypothetical protein